MTGRAANGVSRSGPITVSVQFKRIREYPCLESVAPPATNHTPFLGYRISVLAARIHAQNEIVPAFAADRVGPQSRAGLSRGGGGAAVGTAAPILSDVPPG